MLSEGVGEVHIGAVVEKHELRALPATTDPSAEERALGGAGAYEYVAWVGVVGGSRGGVRVCCLVGVVRWVEVWGGGVVVVQVVDHTHTHNKQTHAQKQK